MRINPAIAAGLNPDDLIQVVYVHLANGRVLTLLGPPISEEEMEEIREVTFGERITSTMLYMMTELHKRSAVH